MERTFYGYWTCDYCGEENRGDSKTCHGCGKTRGKDIKFYTDSKTKSEPRVYTERKEKGPDWHCSYCDSLNPDSESFCKNCGHPRDEEDKDYFDLHPERNAVKSEPVYKPAIFNFDEARHATRVLTVTVLVFIAVLGLVFFLIPSTRDVTILDKSWERQVEVEEYRTVHEEDWSIPAGGRMTGSYSAIHHYEDVLDHYETVTKSRSVADGGHYESDGYTDNGDGTFTERSHWVTDYKTEYYTDEEPVYRSEPVYQIKYQYDIERWVFDHYETTSGHLDEPYFAEPELDSTHRTSATIETYRVTATYEKRGKNVNSVYTMDLADWQKVDIGAFVTVKIHLNKHLEVVDSK